MISTSTSSSAERHLAILAVTDGEQCRQKQPQPLPRFSPTEQVVQQLIDYLPDGLLLLNHASNIELISRCFFSLFGLDYEPAHWLNQPAQALWSRVQPFVASPAGLFDQVSSISHTNGPTCHEQLTLYCGTVLSCEAAPAADGGWLLRLRDVSEQQHQLKELQSIACIVEPSPNLVVRIGANKQQLYANPAARRLGGSLPRAQRVKVQHQLRAGAIAAFIQAKPLPMEVKIGELTFNVSAVPFPEKAYVDLYFNDITERELVRRQLHEHQLFMEQVLDTIPALVFVRDAEQNFVFQNQATQNALQATPLANGQIPAPDSQSAQELAEYAAVDAQVLATGEEVTLEETLTLANGITQWYHTVKRP